MTAHTYQQRRDEALQIAARALELAAEADGDDPVVAHRLRMIAALGHKVVRSTDLRMADLAVAGGEGQ